MDTYTLAFGPFTPLWRNPQRLVLSVAGEVVVDVHYQGGYNERGCAERLARLSLEQALFLVSRVSGPCSHAHSLAFCQALETLLQASVPPRAAFLRCAVAEVERMASHLDTLAALFETLGQRRYVRTLRELEQVAHQAMLLLSGARIIPDICVPGGVRRDLDDQPREELTTLMTESGRVFSPLLEHIISDAALSARTVNVGTLRQTAAEQLGLRGPLARASGINQDVRLTQPYAAYGQLGVSRIIEEGGDVYARMLVLLLEAFESLKLVDQVLQELPAGAWEGAIPGVLAPGSARAAVESPHGMLRYTVESDGRRLTAVAIDPPQQLNRLVARSLLTGALVDNIALIVRSVDSCVACAEG
ncbi:MAG: NADH-quinone oxidoreductase subunit D [Chloroflexaceae bacterium]|nr:NADH-quinone oxidoreductase subunit D [Chloroflexaceae bacterium]